MSFKEKDGIFHFRMNMADYNKKQAGHQCDELVNRESAMALLQSGCLAMGSRTVSGDAHIFVTSVSTCYSTRAIITSGTQVGRTPPLVCKLKSLA